MLGSFLSYKNFVDYCVNPRFENLLENLQRLAQKHCSAPQNAHLRARILRILVIATSLFALPAYATVLQQLMRREGKG